MQLCKVQLKSGDVRAGVLGADHVRLFGQGTSLSDVLHADQPGTAARATSEEVAVGEVRLLAPLDRQEVWAAGVTYKRSQEARERESVGAAQFYDKVYSAERPELFFKATPERVVGPGGAVRVRRDSKWSVPEPELTLVVSPKLRVVGFTIGNDMSARDIEGDNPLYLPQAKIYAGACAVGPVVTLAEAMPKPEEIVIRLTIARGGKTVFDGSTRASQMARGFDDLVGWLGRENQFPHGALLLTGTGIVPPDEFTLAVGDRIAIEVSGVGKLENIVGE
jgi:2-dehydro-3-deoxy-D-arabinonate dehydratase